MRELNIKKLKLLFCIVFVVFLQQSLVYAAEKNVYSNSGYALPRFVSLANEQTNVRSGPGQKYPVKWVINRKSLPVEVILEFDHWRKIKDHEGEEGWVFHTLLSGKRTAIIMAKETIPAYKKPISSKDEKSIISIYLEPFVIADIQECEDTWCKITASGYTGWVERKSLWGVYETENID